MHKEYVEKFFTDTTMADYFDDVIEHVIKRVDDGTVCDLGSHAVGHIWAAGYIERVESYSCYDLSAEAITLFKEEINNIKPGFFQKKYPLFIEKLYKKGATTIPVQDVDKQIVEKLDVVKVFDFLNDTPDKKYDFVIGNESLQVVHTYEDFLKALGAAYNFLKDGGTLLTVSGPYEKLTEEVKQRQLARLEGSLPASAELFERAMLETGFKDFEIKIFPVKNLQNYNQLFICSARK